MEQNKEQQNSPTEQGEGADQAVLSDSSMACKNKTERFNLLCKILNKRGWSLVGVGCDTYALVDQNGYETDMVFWSDRIEIRNSNLTGTGSIVFYLDKCYYRFLENSGRLTIGNRDGIFIMI